MENRGFLPLVLWLTGSPPSKAFLVSQVPTESNAAPSKTLSLTLSLFSPPWGCSDLGGGSPSAPAILPALRPSKEGPYLHPEEPAHHLVDHAAGLGSQPAADAPIERQPEGALLCKTGRRAWSQAGALQVRHRAECGGGGGQAFGSRRSEAAKSPEGDGA